MGWGEDLNTPPVAARAYHPHMGVWPVVVQGWQQECCGDPFAVGDRVEWTLLVLDERATPVPDELLVDVRATVEGEVADEGVSALHVVTSDGLSAAWKGPLPPEGGLEVRALLQQEHHGEVPEGVPPTRGIVRRIRLITEAFEQRAERTWRPTGAIDALRDVPESPDSFGSDFEQSGLSQTGMLVDLEVTPSQGPPAPPPA